MVIYIYNGFIRPLYLYACVRLHGARLINMDERCRVRTNLPFGNKYFRPLYLFARVRSQVVRLPSKYFALGPFAHNPVRRPCVLHIDYLIKISVQFFLRIWSCVEEFKNLVLLIKVYQITTTFNCLILQNTFTCFFNYC